MPDDEPLYVDCAPHGKRVAAVVCRHIIQASDAVGFVESRHGVATIDKLDKALRGGETKHGQSVFQDAEEMEHNRRRCQQSVGRISR